MIKIKIKPLADIKANFKGAIPRVAAEYKKQALRVTDFKEKALAGDELWKEKIAIAVEEDRRKKGLEKMEAGAWRKGIEDKGVKRIGPGMSAAVDKQSRNFAPFHSELGAMELPARTADPLTNVTNRVGMIAVKLAAKKKELRG